MARKVNFKGAFPQCRQTVVDEPMACNAQIPDSLNRCTRDAGHPGDHRCLAVDVDRRNRATTPPSSAERTA